MKLYRVLTDSPSGLWRRGEVGRLVHVDQPLKYHIWLDFGDQPIPDGIELLGLPVHNIRRVFGFYRCQVERLTD